jgi:hypothetical protein
MACAMPVVTTAVLAAASLAPAAHAQDRREPSPNAVPELVDQRVADRNSLGHSLRVMQVDLSPHGFERVYKVPGRDDLLMRTNGALYAVYSQSAYAADTQRKGAIKAIVPAATALPSAFRRIVNLLAYLDRAMTPEPGEFAVLEVDDPR